MIDPAIMVAALKAAGYHATVVDGDIFAVDCRRMVPRPYLVDDEARELVDRQTQAAWPIDPTDPASVVAALVAARENCRE